MLVEVHVTHNPLRNLDYLIACPETGEALALDPWEPSELLALAKERGWTIRHIVSTHEHPDHTRGNLELSEATGATVSCHAAALSEVPGATRGLRGGEVLRVGRLELEVLDTPGHTMSHVCLVGHADTPAVFSGDTLFNAGAGNCHNGGDPRLLFRSFRDILARLPLSTALYPGHDYLFNNLRFTLSREPGNADAQARLVGLSPDDPPQKLSLAEERGYNTFFRLDSPEVIAGLQAAFPGRDLGSEEERFVALRELRNRW